MYVCVCRCVNAEELRKIINEKHVTNVKQLLELNIGDNCKLCLKEAKTIIRECNYERNSGKQIKKDS